MTSSDDSSLDIEVINYSENKKTVRQDTLAVEEPLEIRLGYTDQRKGRLHRSISITMRTPGDDKHLAVGFLFSENIIQNYEQIQSIDDSKANVIRIELLEGISLDLIHLERHFYTTSSCGICGKASLEALSINGGEVNINNNFQVSKPVLLTMNKALREHQVIFNKTGGNHATAAFNNTGKILKVTEDVGRHNAMDKLIGDLLIKDNLPMKDVGLMVSGRSSFELMQKALMAGCPMLLAVGAPSSLAVDLAQEYNITLVGFLGDKSFNIYHGAKNIID